jgi:hypothetical protein
MKYGDTLSVIEVNTKKEVYTFLRDFTGLRVSEIYRRNISRLPYVWREGRMDNHHWMVIDKDFFTPRLGLCKKRIPTHPFLV